MCIRVGRLHLLHADTLSGLSVEFFQIPSGFKASEVANSLGLSPSKMVWRDTARVYIPNLDGFLIEPSEEILE